MSGRLPFQSLTLALKLCYFILVKQKGTLALTVCAGGIVGAALPRGGLVEHHVDHLTCYCRPSGRTRYFSRCGCALFCFINLFFRRYAVKKVGLIMGSNSDLPTVQKAAEVLDSFGVPYEMHIYSAH